MKINNAAVASGGGGGAVAARSSRGAAAARWPHGKGDMAPWNPAAKRMVDPTAGTKPPHKTRHHGPLAAPARPTVLLVAGEFCSIEFWRVSEWLLLVLASYSVVL